MAEVKNQDDEHESMIKHIMRVENLSREDAELFYDGLRRDAIEYEISSGLRKPPAQKT